jgi:hypothetical protein
MRCLRIYATPDGESHFGDVDIPMTCARRKPSVGVIDRKGTINCSGTRESFRVGGRTVPDTCGLPRH